MAVTLYWIVQADATATPTGAQIVAGQDGTGATALASGSEAYTSAGDYSEASAITGLTAGTPYEQCWVAYDGSTYSSVATATITTTGVTVTLSNLGVNDITATSVQPQLDYAISGTPDSADTTYFAVYPSGSTPTWTLVGGWNPLPVAEGTDTNPPTVTTQDDAPGITLSGLTAGTSYKLAAVWDDGIYTSGVVCSAAFTTASNVVATTSLAAVVQAAQAATATASAVVQTARAASATVSAAVNRSAAASSDLAAAVAAAQAVTASLQAAAQADHAQSADLAAAVRLAQAAAASMQLAAQAALSHSASLSAAASSTSSLDAALNAAVRAARTGALSVSAMVLADALVTAGLSAAVQAPATVAVGLSAALSQVVAAASVLSASVQAAQAASATVTAFVLADHAVAAAMSVAVQFAADLSASIGAVVAEAREADVALSAALSVRRVVDASVSTVAAIGQALAVGLSVFVGTTGTGVGDPEAVWNFVLPNGKTAGQTLMENNEMLRIVLAGIAGQTSGVGTDTETYYGIDGITPRIIATFDSAGNRIDTVVDGTE